MAGGIDWFRWHHGSVNDPKFQLVARRAGASVAEVVAVWACLLESASQSGDRGNPGKIDFEAIDCGLGMRDGASESIYRNMRARGLVDDEGRIVSSRRYLVAPATGRPSGGAWAAIRSFVFNRDDFTCQYCGARGVKLECDHMVPVADGGSNDPSNLKTACFRCNRSKGSRSLEQWGGRVDG